MARSLATSSPVVSVSKPTSSSGTRSTFFCTLRPWHSLVTRRRRRNLKLPDASGAPRGRVDASRPSDQSGPMAQKVVLVTGASSGLGRACADLLDQRGWEVVGASRRGTGGSWTGLVMDVDDDEMVRRGVDGVVTAHGRLDAVVAAAGWGLAGPVEETPIADAKAQLETNLWGVVRVVQAALPHMRRQGGGRLLLGGSIGGAIGLAPDSPYRAASIKAISQMVRDEQGGADPRAVADLVVRLLDAKKVPRRVTVGKLDERAGVLAKRLLPFSIFERAAKSSLGI